MRRIGLIAGLMLAAGAGLATQACVQALAVEWSAPMPVPGSRGTAVSRVAVSRDDTVAVAGDQGFVAIRLPAGRWLRVHTLAGAGRLITSTCVAFDARGRLFIAWTQAKGSQGAYRGPFEIRTETWTRGGGWGRVTVLGRSGNFRLAQPQIATDARGDAIVSWRGLRRTGSHLVEAVSTSFRPANRGWGPTQQTASGGPYRDVTLDAHGNAYAVWTTYASRNWFSMRPLGSGRWGSPRALPGSPASAPTVAATPRGAALIAWRAAIVDSEGEGTQYGPVRAIVRTPSGRWGRVQALSGVRVHGVQAAVSPTTGHVLLTWGAPPQSTTHPVPGATDMRFSLFSGAGALSPERVAPGSAAGPLAYRPNGDAVVVFSETAPAPAGPGVLGPIRFTALVTREPTFSEPVTIVAHGVMPALAGAPTTSGRIEMAMSYATAGGQLALSILAARPGEPRG